MLERASRDVIVAIVAHELAHIVLGHNLFTKDEYDQQEQEAFELICDWGFEREARKHQAVNRWRRSVLYGGSSAERNNGS